jgi:hypothetical protein
MSSLTKRELREVSRWSFVGPISLLAQYWSLLLHRAVTVEEAQDGLRRLSEERRAARD